MSDKWYINNGAEYSFTHFMCKITFHRKSSRIQRIR